VKTLVKLGAESKAELLDSRRYLSTGGYADIFKRWLENLEAITESVKLLAKLGDSW
jgi:hypothetical protein